MPDDTSNTPFAGWTSTPGANGGNSLVWPFWQWPATQAGDGAANDNGEGTGATGSTLPFWLGGTVPTFNGQGATAGQTQAWLTTRAQFVLGYAQNMADTFRGLADQFSSGAFGGETGAVSPLAEFYDAVATHFEDLAATFDSLVTAIAELPLEAFGTQAWTDLVTPIAEQLANTQTYAQVVLQAWQETWQNFWTTQFGGQNGWGQNGTADATGAANGGTPFAGDMASATDFGWVSSPGQTSAVGASNGADSSGGSASTAADPNGAFWTTDGLTQLNWTDFLTALGGGGQPAANPPSPEWTAEGAVTPDWDFSAYTTTGAGDGPFGGAPWVYTDMPAAGETSASGDPFAFNPATASGASEQPIAIDWLGDILNGGSGAFNANALIAPANTATPLLAIAGTSSFGG
ncbi:MAG: hypothetical protein AB7J19_07175 [Beijerinckiaceae bacterium]